MAPWLGYCLLVLLFWGAWAFLPRLATRTLDTSSTLVFQQVGAMVAAVAVLACARFKLKAEPVGVSLAFVTGVLGVLGLLCYLQAVVRYRLSVVVMLTCMYPIITVALSVAILRERINGLQWLGVCFALLAILLLSAPGK